MHAAPLTVDTLPGRREGTTVLRLTGPLTLGNLSSFQSCLRTLDAPRLILDMTRVEYIDSAGLGALVNGFVAAEKNGRAFLLAGVNARVLTLLELTRVHTVLKLYPGVREAESAPAGGWRHF
ncbi:MAG: STAS domain-containing protein [Rhodospirillales bacterium]|nr:STAS domain-containing protein [Acetobacter sp.]